MSNSAAAPPLVLTIAGFDPTSGAGITADLKAFAANHCYGLACITALTVQNTLGVQSWQAVDAGLLRGQLEAVFADVPPRAVKIGMLGNRQLVEVIAEQLERRPPAWVVLDPVWQATSGPPLIDDAGWNAMLHRLLPLTSIVTPNLDEAQRLSGMTIAKTADMEPAARALHKLGPRHVVITGGHWEKPADFFFDGEKGVLLTADRVRGNNTHGAGCTFAAALAAILAKGKQPADAVVEAKAYLTAALRNSYPIGAGRGPINHLFRLQEALASRNVDPAPVVEHTTR